MPTSDSIQQFVIDSLRLVSETSSGLIDSGQAAPQDYQEMLFRMFFNLVTAWILIRAVYYREHRNKDYLFTFFLFNFLIFLICILLSSATIKIGLAFGLFAIFSILRYRTVTIPIKEMGYLFASVSVGIINALANEGDYYVVLFACNILILLMAWMLERQVSLNHENYKEIIYERIDLIHPDKYEELKADLIKRTGLPIHRIEIRNINFLRDTANIQVYYFSPENDNRLEGTRRNE